MLHFAQSELKVKSEMKTEAMYSKHKQTNVYANDEEVKSLTTWRNF